MLNANLTKELPTELDTTFPSSMDVLPIELQVNDLLRVSMTFITNFLIMYKIVIGVDISKASLDCSLKRWQQKKTIHKKFLNQDLGFKQIVKWVQTHITSEESFFFCMEHTGYYGFKFCQFIEKQNWTYAAVNPLQIKHSLGFRREKTDKADAQAIAQFGLRCQDELFFNDNLSEQLLPLQVMVNQRKYLQKLQLGIGLRINNLTHCLSDDFVKLIAANSLNLQHQIRKEQINVERKIKAFIRKHPTLKVNYDLLASVPGVGPVIAWNMIIHTHNFKKFTKPRKFACYCSAAPFKRQSGTSIYGATKVSFFGNRLLKSILYLGAMNARKNDPELKAYYDRKMEEKNNHNLVMNALINKLIHRIFATIKRGTPYVIRPVY